MQQTVHDTDGAAGYYNDTDVSAFYRLCWDGEDIHIGHYTPGNETIAKACAAMTQLLIQNAHIVAGQYVLDIACGFGGTLRTLARLGCHVEGIDISERCVAAARSANRAAGLDDRINVSLGDFHMIDSPPGKWDAVICQESLIHSPDRPKVFAEAFRVLRPGGVFVFSDILTGDKADIALVDAAFARLGVAPGATVQSYVDMATDAGFKIEHVQERQSDIKIHYDKLAKVLDEQSSGLSPDAMASIASSIERWQRALAGGHITWAYFVARKPNPV
ncbi:SAM-dependent methyltransferase [Marimonas lutisalis]|uniref:SAM-dependent methyltransferase n=1 Tax=Marimonas lutisalis TaxID=2545756 RepID=UPI0010F8BF73|nr:class I SAM-dependent methyltransferase [Marimonas lutisalis]